MIRIALAVSLSAGIAGGVLAQTQQPPFVPGDNDATAQLTKIVETARNDGLPVDPILAKVQYSIRVTHAEPSRVVASARAVAARLQVARDALAPASANDIAAGADALAFGADGDALRAVRGASGNKPVATPLGVLVQLLGSQVPLKKATEIVTSFIRRGATAEQLVAFGNNVNADVSNGAAALAALDARARFLSGVLAPGGPSSAAAAAPGLSSGVPKKP